MRAWRWLLPALAASLVAAGFQSDRVLAALGHALVRHDPVGAADVVAVVRGDSTYQRAVAAAQLYNAGLAPVVYVSSALSDLPARRLQRLGVEIASDQAVNVAVLRQMGVPAAAIFADSAAPGGGTLGEMRRLVCAMRQRHLGHAILVTNWYHTSRLGRIAGSVGAGRNIRFTIVPAEDESIAAATWWRQRYVAIAVLEEYVKWAIWLGGEGTQLHFSDDPQAGSCAPEANP